MLGSRCVSLPPSTETEVCTMCTNLGVRILHAVEVVACVAFGHVRYRLHDVDHAYPWRRLSVLRICTTSLPSSAASCAGVSSPEEAAMARLRKVAAHELNVCV